MPLIPFDKLHADPRNANHCLPEVMKKLKTHISTSNFCPALLVRPHPKLSGQFIILDGHHRKKVVEELGWKEIECQVKPMTDEQAQVFLLTLNRLRGTDIPRKRAELMQELLPTIPLEELSLLLPESKAEIEGLLALLSHEEDALEKALKEHMDAERQSLPVPFGFMVSAEDVDIVHQALSAYQAKTQSDQGSAFVAICRDVLRLNFEVSGDG